LASADDSKVTLYGGSAVLVVTKDLCDPNHSCPQIQARFSSNLNNEQLQAILKSTLFKKVTDRKGETFVVVENVEKATIGENFLLLSSKNGSINSGSEYLLEIKLPSTIIKADVTEPKNSKPSTVLSKAQSRNDANYYFNGSVDGATGRRAYYNFDIKYLYQTDWKALFYPSFLVDSTGSTDPNGSPDTVNIGFIWQPELWKISDHWHLYLQVNPKMEADQKFEDVNGLFTARITPSYLYSTANNKWYVSLNPFAGFEGGYNFANPISAAKNKSIARGIWGGEVVINRNLEYQYLKGVSLDASFVDRIIAQKETVSQINSSGQFTVHSSNSTPKNYTDVKIAFDLNDYFSATMEYQYGQVPPVYKLVENRYLLGITFKAK
jgi:hypothetical protein